MDSREKEVKPEESKDPSEIVENEELILEKKGEKSSPEINADDNKEVESTKPEESKMNNETKEFHNTLENKGDSYRKINEENNNEPENEEKGKSQTDTKDEEKKVNERNKEKHIGIIKYEEEDATKAGMYGGWKTKKNKRKGKRALERDMIEDELLYKNLFQINIPQKPLLC